MNDNKNTAAQPLDLDKQRELFEQEANAARFFPAEIDFSRTKSPSGRDEYANSHLQSRWEGWQAAIIAQARASQPEGATGTTGATVIWPSEKFVHERIATLMAEIGMPDDTLLWNAFSRFEADLRSRVEAMPACPATATASIDTLEFQALAGTWCGAAQSCDQWTRTIGAKQAWADLIAYTDARLAAPASAQPDRGAAKAPAAQAGCEHCEGGFIYNNEHTRRIPCLLCPAASPASTPEASPASQPVAPEATHVQQEAAPAELCIGVSNNDEGVHINVMRSHADGSATVLHSAKCPKGDSFGRFTITPVAAVAPSDAKGKADAANVGGLSSNVLPEAAMFDLLQQYASAVGTHSAVETMRMAACRTDRGEFASEAQKRIEACALREQVRDAIKSLYAATIAAGQEAANVKDAALLKALHAAVSALYFDDSSDFRSALGAVIRHLDREMAGEMLGSPKAAYDKVCAAMAAAPSSEKGGA